MSENNANALWAILAAVLLRASARDFGKERFARLGSRVEPYLRNAIMTLRMLQWLHGSFMTGSIHCANGRFRLVINNDELSALGASTASQHNILPLDRQPGCEPRVIRATFIQAPGCAVDAHLNGDPVLETPFAMLRLCSLAQFIPVIRTEALQPLGASWIPRDQRLLLHDDIAMKYLAGMLGLTDRLVDERGLGHQWQRCFNDMGTTYDANAELIPFHDVNGSLSFTLELLRVGNKVLQLPTSFFQHPNHPTPLRLYIPPRRPFCLYNASLVAKFPKATVVFSDELAIATSNASGPELVFCSFFGGAEAIPHLDITPLAGRRVVWLLLDGGGANRPRTKYTTALMVAKKLGAQGVDLRFADFTALSWRPSLNCPSLLAGHCDGIKVMSQDEVVQETIRQRPVK